MNINNVTIAAPKIPSLGIIRKLKITLNTALNSHIFPITLVFLLSIAI